MMGGRSVWVIGGDSGIGAATCKELRSRGFVVDATGKSDVDVRNEHAMKTFWNACGGFDNVVYSAGINCLQWNFDQNMDIVEDLFDVNVFGLMRLIKIMARVPWPIEKPFNVVAVSSDAATRPMRTSQAYCASKAALNSVVKQSAREHANLIRINAVSPGMIDDTGMTRYIDETVPKIRGWGPDKTNEYERSQIAMGRRGRPLEVAHAIADVLAGPDYMTGAIIEINGGR